MRPSVMPLSAMTALAFAALLAVPLHAGDGALDTSFGSGGVFTYAINLGGSDNEEVSDLVPGTGGLFVVGYGDGVLGNKNWYVMKLDDAGNVAGAGTAIFDNGGAKNDFAKAAVDDTNGGLIVAGTADDVGHNDIEVCRFLETPISATIWRDSGWADLGCREFDLGSGTYFDVTSIARVPGDVGYVVGGTIIKSSGTGFFLLRVFENGYVDPFYGSSGIATVTFSEGNSTLRGLAVDRGLGVLLVGYASDGFTEYMAFAKVTGDGVLDTGWNFTGKEVFYSPAPALATCAAFDGTQPFAVGLEVPVELGFTSTASANRMDYQGDLSGAGSDVTWDADGKNEPLRILFQGDGSFVVASEYDDPGLIGQVFAGTRFPCLACTPDTSFGFYGLAKYQPAAHFLGAGTLTAATLWGGRLVEGGYVDGAGNDDWIVVRFTSAKAFADGYETGDPIRWSGKSP